MNLINRLNARLSNYSAMRIYVAGLVDSAITIAVVGLIVAKIAQ